MHTVKTTTIARNILVALLFASVVPHLTVDDSLRTRRTVEDTFFSFGSADVEELRDALLISACSFSAFLVLVLSVVV